MPQNVLSGHIICSLMTERSDCDLLEIESEVCLFECWLADCVCHGEFGDTLIVASSLLTGLCMSLLILWISFQVKLPVGWHAFILGHVRDYL